jgi:hypothetical protein
MNIVVKDTLTGFYFLYSVRLTPGGEIIVRTEKVGEDGSHYIYSPAVCKSEEDAVKRCKDSARNKMRYGDSAYEKVELVNVPAVVKKYFASDLKDQLSQVDAIALIEKTKTERYVFFKDNSGLENFFDLEVQYLGYETDDSGIIQVYDRFGELRDVDKSRLRTIVKTEDCISMEISAMERAKKSKVANLKLSA